MYKSIFLLSSLILISAGFIFKEYPDIYKSTLSESGQSTSEISTEELIKDLAGNAAYVFDTRPSAEFSVSHIPGALNGSAKPCASIALYISDKAEIERLVIGNKNAEIVLYCNGPFCGKSKRLSDELVNGGFKNVRRYQLGIPVWRALGGVTQIETSGVSYVYSKDKTAVFADARDEIDFKNRSIQGAVNIPLNKLSKQKDTGEIKLAKEDGRLPMNDHNTRIIVFGNDGKQARAAAEAIVMEAFHNVSFFDGSFDELEHVVKNIQR